VPSGGFPIAQLPRPHLARGFPEMLAATPHRPYLHDALVLARGVAHQVSFLDRLRQRLLNVYVLTRLHRRDRHVDVPVIRHGDDDGIDAPVIQDTPEIFHIRGLEALPLGKLWADGGIDGIIDIADGRDARARGDGAQPDPFALVPCPDQRQGNALVRSHRPGIQIQRGCRGGGFHKVPAGLDHKSGTPILTAEWFKNAK
jgi:hypothetical protein